MPYTTLDHFENATYHEILFKDGTVRNIFNVGENHYTEYKYVKTEVFEIINSYIEYGKQDEIFVEKPKKHNNNIISIPEYYYLLGTNSYECIDIFSESPRGRFRRTFSYQLDSIDGIFSPCSYKFREYKIENKKGEFLINCKNIYPKLRYHQIDLGQEIGIDITHTYKSHNSLIYNVKPEKFLNYIFDDKNDKHDKLYGKSKYSILKEYKKSILYLEDVELLKDIIIKSLPQKFNSNRFLNEIYSLFRMTVDSKNWEKERENNNCRGYPKNIIYHSGDTHRKFLDNIFYNLNESKIIEDDFQLFKNEPIENYKLPFGDLIFF